MTRSPAEPDIAKLAEAGRLCACFNLRKAARAVTSLYDEALRPTGVRGTQFTLLMITRVLGSVSITRLAEVAVMDRTTLTRNLRLLEKKGLIRIGKGDDRRVREVTLRPRGLSLLAKAIPVWQHVQARVARDLGEERLKRMVADLNATVSVVRQG